MYSVFNNIFLLTWVAHRHHFTGLDSYARSFGSCSEKKYAKCNISDCLWLYTYIYIPFYFAHFVLIPVTAVCQHRGQRHQEEPKTHNNHHARNRRQLKEARSLFNKVHAEFSQLFAANIQCRVIRKPCICKSQTGFRQYYLLYIQRKRQRIRKRMYIPK